MIGSPWNPFFQQPIPGTATRYNGRRVDSGDYRQMGAFDLVSLPHYLKITQKDFGDVILTRDYGLFGTGGRVLAELMIAAEIDDYDQTIGNLVVSNTQLGGTSAEVLQAVYGDAWGTQTLADVFKTGFLWWYSASGVTHNSQLPRVLYRSEYFDATEQHAAGWWSLGAGIYHTFYSAGIGEAYPFQTLVDYEKAWSAWFWDSAPTTMGGEKVGNDEDPYWVYVREGEWEADIPAGSRLRSPIDLNRRFCMPTIQLDEKDDTPLDWITVEPWYREGW